MVFTWDIWNNIPAFRDLSVDHARAIPTILACSGLLHDMGNPPFGHEGENAIGYWFESHFDSNAQVVRLSGMTDGHALEIYKKLNAISF